MLDLIDRMSKGDSLEDVKGVIFRKGPEFVDTGEGAIIKDLSQLPMMPLHLFDMKRYFPLPGTFRKLPSITMATTRGCPFKCTFCNSKGNVKVRVRPPISVVDEVETLVELYGAKEIYFVDELFTLKRSNIVIFCEELIKRKIKIGWKCCARVFYFKQLWRDEKVR